MPINKAQSNIDYLKVHFWGYFQPVSLEENSLYVSLHKGSTCKYKVEIKLGIIG